jgi:hypothetical protein
MLVMQYAISLPSDYKMEIIRRRIENKAPLFDQLPGLGVKVFAVREVDQDMSLVNEYAPIYLWPNVESIWNFVAGEGLTGIINSFGRVTIDYWPCFAFGAKRALDWREITAVTREVNIIGSGTDLVEYRRHEMTAVKVRCEESPDLGAEVVAIDMRCWSVLRFCFWLRRPPLDSGSVVYRAAHVSCPAADALLTSMALSKHPRAGRAAGP